MITSELNLGCIAKSRFQDKLPADFRMDLEDANTIIGLRLKWIKDLQIVNDLTVL